MSPRTAQLSRNSGYPCSMGVGKDNYSGNVVSRSRMIIGLLILILLLVLSLVWQASKTMHSNRETATQVLQDYARLVCDEFARRAMGEIGYYGYYAQISSISQQFMAGADILAPDQVSESGDSDAPGSTLALYRFLIVPESAEVRFSQRPDTAATIKAYLLRKAVNILGKGASESGFYIDHATIEGRARSFVFARANDPDRVFGFAVDRSGLAERLRQLFERDALLPRSLAGGEITNEYIFLRFTDHNNQVLFQSREAHDPYLLAFRDLKVEYEGVFDGHTIAAAIDSSVADSLVIGGLPRSRLPVLIITVLLTVGLLIAAIRQLYLEHALMKMRSNFVSEVSHELRTPLTQIRMFAETLLFERYKTADDKRRALEIINRESQRLIHLVENVLRFSGRDGGQRDLALSRTDLVPLVQRVVDEFRPLAEGTGNSLHVDLDARAEAEIDTDALRQILLNLLDNAIKYGPEDQEVRVSLQRRSDSIRLSVCDQGPGIPRADREKIWGGYYRLERERDSAIAGTGIGLAVVRELVTLHGGSVRVVGSDAGGACFVVEIPIVQESR